MCLEGTGVLERIGCPEEDFKSGFLKIAKKFEVTKSLSEDILKQLYFYAGSLVSSYSFMEDDGTIVMVPMADMLNHRAGHNNARLFFEKDSLHMTAIKDMAAGEQIYNTYGDISNTELLFKYGYLDDINEHCSVELHIQDFIEYVQTKTNAKLKSLEAAYDKGTIPESIELSYLVKASTELDKWFTKVFGKDDHSARIVEFLKFRLGMYTHFIPTNDNQRLAKKLVEEHQQILNSYLNTYRK